MNKSTQENSILYKGYSLNRYLINYHDTPGISLPFKQNFKKVIKKILWPLSFFGNFLIGKVSYKENNFVNSDLEVKYLFVVCFPEKHRSFPVLNNLIKIIPDKNNMLVVTDCIEVYQYYSLQKIKCIYLRISGLVFDKSLMQEKYLNSDELFILSKVKLHFDRVEVLMDKFQPKLTLTLCDSLNNEKVFAEVAQRKGFISITHQHGMMVKTNLSIPNNTVSDFIVLWGERTKQNFIGLFKKTKIVVLGTDIYQHLPDEKGEYRKEFITLALNLKSDKLNKYLIDKVCSQMTCLGESEKRNYSFVLKLHPEMNFKYWESLFLKAMKRHSLKMNCHVYSYENKLVLNKSKILIVLSSGISMEAFICGVSVICIDDIPNFYINPLVYFKNIPESIVNIENISLEIQNRLNNTFYSNKILAKQKKSLKEEIAYFDSSKRELDWINQLIK
jgi:hypothetical protein